MSFDARKIVISSTLVVFLAGLLLFAYLGIYNRYWSDDWCINADLSELGFIGTLKGYTYITTYSSNRVSLIFFSGILYYLGILGVQLMSPIGIGLLTLSLYWCLHNIKTAAKFPVSNTILWLFPLIVLYYSIYLAPNLYQSLYWRSASLPYFSPIVMGVLVLALITHQSVRERPAIVLIPIVTLLSFMAGGFSEAGCATLTTVLVLYIAFAWLYRKQTWANRSLPTAIAALAGTLLAMVVLISSPTTTYRVGLYGEPAPLIDLPGLILRFTFDFIRFSLTDLPLPHLAIIVTAFMLGYLLYTNMGLTLNTKLIMITLLVTSVIAFLVIAASFAPSAYIEKVPPHPRTRIIPRFVLTMTLVFVSTMLGAFIRQWVTSKWAQGLALLIFVLVTAYSVRSVFIASQYIPIYSERAKVWDAREIQILAAAANGEETVFVQAIDGLPVGGIRDFDVKGQGKPGYWINRCAARFYRIGAIDIISP